MVSFSIRVLAHLVPDDREDDQQRHQEHQGDANEDQRGEPRLRLDEFVERVELAVAADADVHPTLRPFFSMTIERAARRRLGVAPVPGLASTVIRALAPPAAPGGLGVDRDPCLGGRLTAIAASGRRLGGGGRGVGLGHRAGSAATAAGCARPARSAAAGRPRTRRRGQARGRRGGRAATRWRWWWTWRRSWVLLGESGGCTIGRSGRRGSDSRPVPDAPPRPGGSVRQVGTACYYRQKGRWRRNIARCAFGQFSRWDRSAAIAAPATPGCPHAAAGLTRS